MYLGKKIAFSALLEFHLGDPFVPSSSTGLSREASLNDDVFHGAALQPIFTGAGRVPLQGYSQRAQFGMRLQVLRFLECSVKKHTCFRLS